MAQKSKVPVNVIIADDHEIFRNGLKLILNADKNISLVGEATNGKELIDLTRSLAPDVVITDIKMPIMDGVEATRCIVEQFPCTRIIALTMFDEEQTILDMLEAGATGYLLKNADKREVLEAVATVNARETYYCKHTSGQLAKLIAYSRRNSEKQKKEAEFSEREKGIIRLICQEYTNKQIAEQVFLSARTIEGYRMRILEKMGAKNIVGIVIESIRLGIYNPDD
jgi:DNA-binding NarL/FixJ family response regulator